MEYWTTSVLFLLLNCGNLAEIAKCLESIIVCIPDTQKNKSHGSIKVQLKFAQKNSIRKGIYLFCFYCFDSVLVMNISFIGILVFPVLLRHFVRIFY